MQYKLSHFNHGRKIEIKSRKVGLFIVSENGKAEDWT